MSDSNGRWHLDDSATTIGILIGLLIGSIYALLNIRHRGETTRKNLTQFGAGSIETDIETSLDRAKQQARQRHNESS